ncbi:hypothetical protein BASA62_007172 [Batrachochytrium salamandrivorans]|nr:hypothetical protein BASA62_007172 [Batrachochytrium salamandrivorans]
MAMQSGSHICSILGQSQQGSKGFSLPDVGKKEPKTILQFWLVDGLEFPQLRDLALQVFGMFGNQNMKDLVDMETESESKVERD